MDNPQNSTGLLASLPHPSYVYAAKIHPAATKDKLLVITGGFDKLVRIWDATAVTVLKTLSYHTAHVNSIVVSPDGYRMVTGSGNGELYLCRFAENTTPWAETRDPRRLNVHGLGTHAISGLKVIAGTGNEFLFVMSRDNKVRVMEMREPFSLVRGYGGLKSQDHSVKATISPDGQYVLSGSDDGRLCIWDSIGDQLVLQDAMDRLPRWPNPVYDVAWHPSQHMIAVASYGKGQQILLFSFEHKSDVRPPLRANLLNSDASTAVDEQQALKMQNLSIKRDEAKKRYFDEYMAVIYATEK